MRFFKRLTIFLIFLIGVVWIISLFAPKSKKIEYGLTFSKSYADYLGLDWKAAYKEILDGLGPKYVRLLAYWNEVEPERDLYYFDDLDFQVHHATERKIKIVMAIGRRLPRWPECHDPDWIKNLPESSLQTEQLSYLEAVVRRYQDNPAIVAWQVENEPFISTFGKCPKLDKHFLDTEIALVKDLDVARPVVITDSGELAFGFYAGARGDVFGTTLYRYVFADFLNIYWTHYFPGLFYRFKAGVLSLLHPGKQVAIMELQAEPWAKMGILNTPIEEQFKTMSLEKFDAIIGTANSTRFSPQYLWGVEWWYWIKNNGHPEFWQRAQTLMQK